MQFPFFKEEAATKKADQKTSKPQMAWLWLWQGVRKNASLFYKLDDEFYLFG